MSCSYWKQPRLHHAATPSDLRWRYNITGSSNPIGLSLQPKDPPIWQIWSIWLETPWQQMPLFFATVEYFQSTSKLMPFLSLRSSNSRDSKIQFQTLGPKPISNIMAFHFSNSLLQIYGSICAWFYFPLTGSSSRSLLCHCYQETFPAP